MIRDLILAIGLVCTSYTQFRLAQFPIGPGEFCLFVWLLFVVYGNATRKDARLDTATTHLLVFWSVFAMSLCIGAMTTYVIGEVHNSNLARHDTIAYGLVAVISIMLAFQENAWFRIQRTAWLVALVGAVTLAAQLLHAWNLFAISGVDPWFWHRLRGWSENANQLAMSCLVLTFVCVHVAETAKETWRRIAALICAMFPVWVGFLTDSHAFSFGLFLGCALYPGFKLFSLLRSRLNNSGVLSLSSAYVLLVLPLFFVAIIVTAQDRLLQHDVVGEMITSEVDKNLGERSGAFTEALYLTVKSWFLGLGPGPHLRSPQTLFIPNFEVHNTLLDVMLQGGLLAVVALIVLGALVLRTNIRAKQDALAALLFCLLLYGSTHFIIRHPIVWFVIVASLATAAREPASNSNNYTSVHFNDRRRLPRVPA